eukprot:CAMPEP_0185207378 /NCGR_PEP_ID=MMETSP1140-20130426/60148_1 /TAXON_ID=298111 /ORGANISM="Pavlova sp., Strain CCMP459" /LENGTH=148 /DNA_ID=CAMNT_0027775063 /DNA_START=319 /DNA_END=763 /DNA_ORIENTATION=-
MRGSIRWGTKSIGVALIIIEACLAHDGGRAACRPTTVDKPLAQRRVENTRRTQGNRDGDESGDADPERATKKEQSLTFVGNPSKPSLARARDLASWGGMSAWVRGMLDGDTAIRGVESHSSSSSSLSFAESGCSLIMRIEARVTIEDV